MEIGGSPSACACPGRRAGRSPHNPPNSSLLMGRGSKCPGRIKGSIYIRKIYFFVNLNATLTFRAARIPLFSSSKCKYEYATTGKSISCLSVAKCPKRGIMKFGRSSQGPGQESKMAPERSARKNNLNYCTKLGLQ